MIKKNLFLAFSVCALCSCNRHLNLLIGSYSDGTTSGISVYDFNTWNGNLEYVSDIDDVINPSYLVVAPDGQIVYAVNETLDGKVSAFQFNKRTAKLSPLNSQSAKSSDPCFININKKGTFIVTANYSSGSISLFPLAKDGHIQPLTQSISMNTTIGGDASQASRIHTVQFSQDGKWIYATDLGKDKIYKFEITSQEGETSLVQDRKATTRLEAGSGPRHLAFHPRGRYIYCMNELSGTVTAFAQDSGRLVAFQTIASDVSSEEGQKGSADIHLSPNGKFLYASNRAEANDIAIFSVTPKDGILTSVGSQKTGLHPRNFLISPNGKFLLCANRDSDTVQVFAINKKTGLLEDTGTVIQVGKPVCLKWVRNSNHRY
ncbi:6-phosphogluconolactonase [Bacteroidia bacterium]|nr:6-phosphogluconolactonase [Bacteroidia bacterium]